MKRTLHIDSLVGPGVEPPRYTAEIAPAFPFTPPEGGTNWAIPVTFYSTDGEIVIPDMEDTYDGLAIPWSINVRIPSDSAAFINARTMNAIRIFPSNGQVDVDLDEMILQDPVSDPTYGPGYLAQTKVALAQTEYFRDEVMAVALTQPKTLEVVGDNLIVTLVNGSTYDAGRVRGLQGNTGSQGIQGIQGVQGIQGPVGPAGLTWRGLWSVGTDYAKNDAVYYQPSGASWFASQDPPVGDVPSDISSFWFPLATRGAQGVQGPQGNPGTPNTLTVGTISKVDAGGTPTATITGASPNQTLNLGVVTGDQGPQGIQGDLGSIIGVSGGSNFRMNDNFLDPETTSVRVLLTTTNYTITADWIPPGSRSFTVTFEITQASTPRTVTWVGVKWAEGIAPIMPTTPGADMVVHLYWNGVLWRGLLAGANFA